MRATHRAWSRCPAPPMRSRSRSAITGPGSMSPRPPAGWACRSSRTGSTLSTDLSRSRATWDEGRASPFVYRAERWSLSDDLRGSRTRQRAEGRDRSRRGLRRAVDHPTDLGLRHREPDGPARLAPRPGVRRGADRLLHTDPAGRVGDRDQTAEEHDRMAPDADPDPRDLRLRRRRLRDPG